MYSFGIHSMQYVVEMPIDNSMHRPCIDTYIHTCAYLHTHMCT